VRKVRDSINEIRMPVFREDVRYVLGTSEARIEGPLRTASLSFDPAAQSQVAKLLDGLRCGGLSLVKLQDLCPDLGEGMFDLLRELDELRLLDESLERPCPNHCSGSQLGHHVARMVRRILDKAGPGDFSRALSSGSASRVQLIGYALEYGWFVSQAPGLIAPAIATAVSAQRRAMLEGFLLAERGHDAFVKKALAAVGIEVTQAWQNRPLPSTLFLAASLSVYAKQHPLSFYAALSLFEKPQPEFIDLFESCCDRQGLPAEFHRPLRAHAELNEREGHGDIGQALLATVSLVGEEEQQLVKRHVGVLAETLLMQEHEIMCTYTEEFDILERSTGN